MAATPPTPSMSIAPSLPGFGFSDKPDGTGWDVERIADAWIALMERLGYDRWVAQGGDWGAAVTTAIGVARPAGLCSDPPQHAAGVPERRTTWPTRRRRSRRPWPTMAHYQNVESGYAKQQRTRPQTLGYGLVDSPVGQAAWIYEKLWAGPTTRARRKMC